MPLRRLGPVHEDPDGPRFTDMPDVAEEFSEPTFLRIWTHGSVLRWRICCRMKWPSRRRQLRSYGIFILHPDSHIPYTPSKRAKPCDRINFKDIQTQGILAEHIFDQSPTPEISRLCIQKKPKKYFRHNFPKLIQNLSTFFQNFRQLTE